MKIDDDVKRIAESYHPNLAPLVQSIVNAEGGGDHITTAVRCSVRDVKDREAALHIVCRSSIHALVDFARLFHDEEFVKFFASRWAPPHAANDPTNLNRN